MTGFFSGLRFLLQVKRTFSFPVCCHAACKMLPVISEMCSLQELSPHLCPWRFFLSNTERILISRIPFSSQKYNLIPSTFSTHFFLSLIPNTKIVSEYDIFPLWYMNVIQRAVLPLHRLSCFQMLHRSL